jgi:hypothetical protein
MSERKNPKFTTRWQRRRERDEDRRWTGGGHNPMARPRGYRSVRELDPRKRRPLSEWLEDHHG